MDGIIGVGVAANASGSISRQSDAVHLLVGAQLGGDRMEGAAATRANAVFGAEDDVTLGHLQTRQRTRVQLKQPLGSGAIATASVCSHTA